MIPLVLPFLAGAAGLAAAPAIATGIGALGAGAALGGVFGGGAAAGAAGAGAGILSTLGTVSKLAPAIGMGANLVGSMFRDDEDERETKRKKKKPLVDVGPRYNPGQYIPAPLGHNPAMGEHDYYSDSYTHGFKKGGAVRGTPKLKWEPPPETRKVRSFPKGKWDRYASFDNGIVRLADGGFISTALIGGGGQETPIKWNPVSSDYTPPAWPTATVAPNIPTQPVASNPIPLPTTPTSTPPKTSTPIISRTTDGRIVGSTLTASNPIPLPVAPLLPTRSATSDIYKNYIAPTSTSKTASTSYSSPTASPTTTYRYAEGGPVETSPEDDAQLIQEAAAAIMGQHPNPDQALLAFVKEFGEAALQDLVQRVRGGGMGQSATGGPVQGPGDGQSDSIPAQIDGQQPAALSSGEFVVPADVVSHLGNGSTEAGIASLQGMMQRARQSRGATAQQPPALDPNQVLPA